MRTGKGYLFRACSSKEVSHHHLSFGRDSKAGGGEGKLYSGKKERRQLCLDWRLLAWGSWRRGLLEQGIL